MQNKGLITLFAVLFGLVSLYQLSFTYFATSTETAAKEYADAKFSADMSDKRDDAEVRYLDSVGKLPIFMGIDYNTAKDKELNKGLDLKGGINVILQVSVKDILQGLANNSKDPAFNLALKNADVLQRDSQDTYLQSFFTAFDALDGENELASPNIFFNKNLEDDITLNQANDEVKVVLERKIDESIASAFEVLRKRIDKFGVTQPNIQRLGKTARILVELPGAKDVDRVTDLVTKTAQLEFWDVYKAEEVGGYLAQVQEIVKGINKAKTATAAVVEVVEEEVVVEDDQNNLDELLGGEEVEEVAVDAAIDNPIFSKMISPGFSGSPVIGTFKAQDAKEIMDYLNLSQARNLLKGDMRYAKFVWEQPTTQNFTNADGEEEELKVVNLYALKGNRQDVPPLSGDVITEASQEYDQKNEVAVSMSMNGKGAKIWKEMTSKAYTNQSQIAIVLDDVVYSAPGISVAGGIGGGRSSITGNFSILEAQDLANVLRAGKLPASAEIIQGEVVGPTLGKEAINSGMLSFGIALILVLLWMILYYGKAGAFADVALVVNILFIFGILAGLGAVLTLPGIAGIVLTIGISVDANVLIFERIREELYKGKSQKDSIKDGFKNALSSILDANITTGLTGLILLVFGTGPIKGFATTLLIGILTSLFTAIFITRLFVDSYTRNGKPLNFSTGLTKNFLRDVSFDFLGKRKVAYIISGILIVASLGSLFTNGLNQGVDFVGGRTYTVRFDQDVDANKVEEDLIAVYGSAEAKTYGGDNQLKITTKYKVNESGTAIDNEIEEKLFSGLTSYLPSGMTLEQFKSDDATKVAGRMESYKVSPTIADDIKTSSLWAIFGSLLVVFLYILLRFRRWQFSLGAVAAVFHDVLIVLGVFSLTYNIMPFSMEIDQSFIAAILTVIGYSLNDTVVVFDRIREYFNERPTWPLSRVINEALNSTLSRTLNTSLTTLIVLLSIFLLGAESIKGLIFALIVGVLVGTYSSLFIATPVMFDTVKKKGIDLSDKKEEEVIEA